MTATRAAAAFPLRSPSIIVLVRDLCALPCGRTIQLCASACVCVLQRVESFDARALCKYVVFAKTGLDLEFSLSPGPVDPATGS